MKVFVAMRPDHPADDDFSETVDGELVCMPFDRCADGNCDCAHTMMGLASGALTTTFTVVDLPHITESLLVEAFVDGLGRAGHVDPATDTGREAARRHALDHIAMARPLPEGGVYWAMHPPAA